MKNNNKSKRPSFENSKFKKRNDESFYKLSKEQKNLSKKEISFSKEIFDMIAEFAFNGLLDDEIE